MKRRSARPFMVEVKQTRPARTSLTATEARSRPDKTLWPELAQAAMEPPASVPQAAPAQRPERKAPETPARRVLPSLVPMFEIPDEPVAEPADEAVPAPRVRRPRRTRAPASEQDIAPQVQAAPPRPAAEPPLPVAEAPGGRVRSRSVAAIDGRAANEGPAARGTLEAASSAGPALTQAALTGPGAFARIRQGQHGPKVSSHPRRQASQAGPAPSAGGLHPVQNRLYPSAPGAARRAARPASRQSGAWRRPIGTPPVQPDGSGGGADGQAACRSGTSPAARRELR